MSIENARRHPVEGDRPCDRFFKKCFFRSMQCVICQEEEEGSAEHTSTLPCGHSFHAGCIAKWLWFRGSCPICRTSGRSEAMHTATDTEEGSDSESTAPSEHPTTDRTADVNVILRKATRHSLTQCGRYLQPKVALMRKLRHESAKLRRELRATGTAMRREQKKLNKQLREQRKKHQLLVKNMTRGFTRQTAPIRRRYVHLLHRVFQVQEQHKVSQENLISAFSNR